LEIWQGKDTNVKTAQQALLHRSQCNRAARRGEYSAAVDPATARNAASVKSNEENAKPPLMTKAVFISNASAGCFVFAVHSFAFCRRSALAILKHP
jgi:Fructose-bisphosphate aldolase class-I